MSIEPGQTISHYRLTERIGEGGMGVVWQAEDTRLQRAVALKFLPEGAAREPQVVERFLREARAASALNHPHICTVHDVGEWEGRRFIVMELLEGRSLRERLEGQPLDDETVVELGVQIADALEAAHGKGIVHRDIKTANIVVNDRGRAKVLDFGLAKLAVSAADASRASTALNLTGQGTAIGTVSYMSPEQARGLEVDSRTDIFSLGIVLYEMATGCRPFSGETSAVVFEAILNRAPTPPTARNADVPVELERIIQKTLEKDPDMRYQSAADLRADLKRLQRDTLSESAVRPAALSRHRGRSRIALAVLGAGLAVAIALYFFLPRKPQPPAGPLQTRPLTSLAGMEAQAGWSPDGGFVAFSHGTPHGSDILVMPSGGGDPLWLVENPGDDTAPRWSPDNRFVAFTSNRGGESAIYLVPPLGGSVRRLTATGLDPLDIGELDGSMGSTPWSPDATSLLFSRAGPTGEIAVWRVDVESGSEEQLTRPTEGAEHLSPSYSPDGNWIVFDSFHSELWLLPSAGGEPRPLLVDDYENQQPAWTPDGKRVVFVSDRAGILNLWEIVVDSGDLRQLTTGAGRDQSPAVARDGRIAYENWSHQTDLYVMTTDSGVEQQLTSHTKDNNLARFSPDGEWIAYESTRTGNSEVWLLHLESGTERLLTDHPAIDSTPDWSPDGREIVFLSDRPGSSPIWTMNVQGGAPRSLGEAAAGAEPSGLAWSPDRNVIGYLAPSEKGLALWIVDPEGSRTEPVLFGVRDFAWYRDSRHVIYTPTGVMELRAADLDSGAEVTLLTEPHTEVIARPDGSAVAYCSARSHYDMNLQLLELSPGSDGLPRVVAGPRRLTDGQGQWHIHNGGFSPDGSRVVYTRDTDSGDIYVIGPGP